MLVQKEFNWTKKMIWKCGMQNNSYWRRWNHAFSLLSFNLKVNTDVIWFLHLSFFCLDFLHNTFSLVELYKENFFLKHINLPWASKPLNSTVQMPVRKQEAVKSTILLQASLRTL